MAHCWERIEEELWKWADVFPAEHIGEAAVQFRAAKQHQECALQQGLLGLRLFSGAMRPNMLPDDVKQRLKATNLVCRDQLVQMILATAGPHSAYDQDQINHVVAWISNGDEELGNCLGFSVLRFLQQLRDQPPAWTQRQGRQAARRRRRANRANPQGASGSEDLAEDPGGEAAEAPEDDQEEPQEEPRESDDDIGDLPSVPPVSRTFINYRQGQQDPRKCWSEPANRAVRREPAEGSEAEEGRTVTHREEEWDDERRDTEREARQESVRKMVHFLLGELKDAEVSMKATWMKQVAQQLSDANEKDCDLHLKRQVIEAFVRHVPELLEQHPTAVPEILDKLCFLSGSTFLEDISLQRWAWELRVACAETWARYCEGSAKYMDTDAIRSTMRLLTEDSTEDSKFEVMFEPVISAMRSLICGHRHSFRDDFVQETGQWLLLQMWNLLKPRRLTGKQATLLKEQGVRSFCALFRYKEDREMLGNRLSSGTSAAVGESMRYNVQKILEELEEADPLLDQNYYAEMFRIAVYAWPLTQLIEWQEQSERGGEDRLKACMKEIFKFLLIGDGQRLGFIDNDELKILSTRPDVSRLKDMVSDEMEKWSEKLFLIIDDDQTWPDWPSEEKRRQEKRWKTASKVLATLFGPRVVAEITTQNKVCKHFVADDDVFYQMCRGLEEWHQISGASWMEQKYVVERFLTICQRLFDDRCDEWGHPSSWSAWVAVLGEFLKGRAIPESGTSQYSPDDERFLFLRNVDSELLKVWQNLSGKYESKQFGTVLEQFVYSLSLFFSESGLRGHYYWQPALRDCRENINRFIQDEMGPHIKARDQITELLKEEPQLGRHASAGRCSTCSSVEYDFRSGTCSFCNRELEIVGM